MIKTLFVTFLLTASTLFTDNVLAQSYDPSDPAAQEYVRQGMTGGDYAPACKKNTDKTYSLYDETGRREVGKWKSDDTCRKAWESYATLISAATMDQWIVAQSEWESMEKMQVFDAPQLPASTSTTPSKDPATEVEEEDHL